MSPSSLTSSSSTVTDATANNEVTTLQEMVDRLLQIPPYSVRIQYIEQSIISAHRRIREQLSVLGSSVGLPQNVVTPSERVINHMHVRPVERGAGGGGGGGAQSREETLAAYRRMRLVRANAVSEENNSRHNFIPGSHS